MYYHTIIMSVFAFLKAPVPNADEATIEPVTSARKKCISSAHIVSDLVAIHRSQWGIHRETASDMQYICVALFVLIDDFDEEKSHNAFLNLAKAAVSFGGR